MTLSISATNKFKRDLKRAKARHWDTSRLKEVVGLLTEEQPLPAKFRDHGLSNP